MLLNNIRLCAKAVTTIFEENALVSARINLPVSLFGIPHPVSSQRLLMGWMPFASLCVCVRAV